MKVFLARHGQALAEGDDAHRALSAHGREVTIRAAGFLRISGALGTVRAVWHSPLRRARESAEVFARELGVDAPLVETPGLLPEDDPVAVAERLERAEDAVLIVGHEPQLSALATLLVRGKVKPAVFAFKKSAVLALETTGGRHKKSGRARWCACWHFSPELLAGGDAA